MSEDLKPRVWRLTVKDRHGVLKESHRVAPTAGDALRRGLLIYAEVVSIEEELPEQVRRMLLGPSAIGPAEEAVLRLVRDRPRYASEFTPVLPCRLRLAPDRDRFLAELVGRGILRLEYRISLYGKVPYAMYLLPDREGVAV